MHIAEIEPRILIVEDSEKIQGFLKRRLDVVKRANGHCLIPDTTTVSTFAGFEQVARAINALSAPFNTVIVDINLGNDHEDDGMKVLEWISEKFGGKIQPLVYTAYPNRRNQCLELGVEKDGFFIKNDGRLTEDIERIKRKIEDKFISAYLSGGIPTDIPLLVTNNRVRRPYRHLKTFLREEDFNGWDEPGTDWMLCSFLSTPIKIGLNVFSLQDRVWNFKFEQFEDTELQPDESALPCFIQEINEHTGQVEGYRLYLNGYTHYINLPDFAIVKQAFDTIVDFAKRENTTASQFAEFFLATRMVSLYAEGSQEEKRTIVDLSKRGFRYPLSGFAFIYGIWKEIGRRGERSQDEHGYFYNQFSQYQEIEIYSSEIIELTGNIASVRMVALIDSSETPVVFYRDILLDVLKNYGVMHVHDRFNIIIYEEVQPKRSTRVVLPIPPNMPY